MISGNANSSNNLCAKALLCLCVPTNILTKEHTNYSVFFKYSLKNHFLLLGLTFISDI